MSAERRPYRKQRRAESEAQTRLRITESLVDLHGSIGPVNTTVSAVADHAGVRRSTVYRHFPDEEAMFAACSSHWAAANPFPDCGAWAKIADPDERLRHALDELYGLYGRTERMMGNLLRDEEHVPVVTSLMAGYRDYLGAARDVLMRGRGLRGEARKRCAGAIGHALSFSTWRSLVRDQELTHDQAVRLMCALADR